VARGAAPKGDGELTTAAGGAGAGELAPEPDEAAMRTAGERASGSGSASRRRSRRVRGEEKRAARWRRSGRDLTRGRSMVVGAAVRARL